MKTMGIGSQECSHVIAEVAHALQQKTATGLSPSAYHHLITCDRCRAGLLLLVGATVPAANEPPSSQICDLCQSQLAAFIDLESSDPVSASTAYPLVWWHLWTCRTCSQTYEFIRMLIESEKSGALQPLRINVHPPQTVAASLWRVPLTRSALARALPSRQPALAITRGAPTDTYVVYDEAEDEPEPRELTITVQEQAGDVWQMVARMQPPPEGGLLVLTAGALRLVAPFESDGTAVIQDIAADLLIDPQSPDLEISVMPPAQD
jgi:hypothetical protein